MPIKPVVSHNGESYNFDKWEESDHEDGVLINSGEFDGQTSEEARKNITAALHERGIGEGKTKFPPSRLANFSPTLLGRANSCCIL